MGIFGLISKARLINVITQSVGKFITREKSKLRSENNLLAYIRKKKNKINKEN